MQAEADGKVKWDSKKKEYKCPCAEKVCNHPVLARVKWVIYVRKFMYWNVHLI